ncbi:MAG: flavodoxin domain-containing protein [Dehalococcoidales bacterium]|nr:flavodoxin domain-containing protein [Dehalococcoidales bacterium]
MKNILVIYHSQTGNTGKMAEAVAEGAIAAGADVSLKKAVDAGVDDLLGCDAVIIGTPNYFSYMAGMVKDFFDRVWFTVREKMEGKPYACFGSYGGGGTPAIESVEKICEGLKMNRVSDCVHTTREPSDEVLAECKALGRKIAEL